MPTVFSSLDVARDWAASGLVPLTGGNAAPLQGPAAIPSSARGALQALKLLLKDPSRLDSLNGASLLSERAALLDLQAGDQVSANGSCRLLATADGWLALNLARDEDRELLPAWLQVAVDPSDWDAVAAQVAMQSTVALVERGRLMGLPVADAESRRTSAEAWFSVAAQVVPAEARSSSAPLVVDLSSLWAGPLCTHLLELAGARVIKVESNARLDGARGGNPVFYDLLNGNKESVVLNLGTPLGREQLKALIARADIVVEASRPRALRQLGIEAEQMLASVPGLTWVSITGYGRGDPAAGWVAFGDDAAVAAGVAMATANPPQFCGDALADPLAGIHAALAAQAFWMAGGGALVDISLTGVTAYCLDFCLGIDRAMAVKGDTEKGDDGWAMRLGRHTLAIAKPEYRQGQARAASAGCDTRRILQEFGIRC